MHKKLAKKRKVVEEIDKSSSISYSIQTDKLNRNSDIQRMEDETQISAHFEDYHERGRNSKQIDSFFKYFEFEIKIVEQVELSDCSYTRNHPF